MMIRHEPIYLYNLMYYRSPNAITSPINLAARNNNVKAVKRLLKKCNPNFGDSQGWTCLHEAAANDSYECLQLILKHKLIKPLRETRDAHTALLLACQYKSSKQTIKALLESDPDIVNFESTDHITPLHITSAQGRVEIVQLLLDYGAMIDAQDFDGDTALHNATFSRQHEVVEVLLHAGADPEIGNSTNFMAFHLACQKGCFECVKHLYPFLNDINQVTVNGDSPLILATQGWNDDVVKFLLKNGANPHLKNKNEELALTMAFNMANSSSFKILLTVTDLSELDCNMILFICKPHYFNLEMLEMVLTLDNIGHEYFDFFDQHEKSEYQPVYLSNPPLNSYLNICEYVYQRSYNKFQEFFYIFLMHGLAVNPLHIDECPPLVHIHYVKHTACFKDAFQILREHGLNVDYCSSTANIKKMRVMPDAFLASLLNDPATTPIMLPYSLQYDPEYILHFSYKYGILPRIPQQVQQQLLSMIDEHLVGTNPETLSFRVLPLKHLCRQQIRFILRYVRSHLLTTNQFLNTLDRINLPRSLKEYLRFI